MKKILVTSVLAIALVCAITPVAKATCPGGNFAMQNGNVVFVSSVAYGANLQGVSPYSFAGANFQAGFGVAPLTGFGGNFLLNTGAGQIRFNEFGGFRGNGFRGAEFGRGFRGPELRGNRFGVRGGRGVRRR